MFVGNPSRSAEDRVVQDGVVYTCPTARRTTKDQAFPKMCMKNFMRDTLTSKLVTSVLRNAEQVTVVLWEQMFAVRKLIAREKKDPRDL